MYFEEDVETIAGKNTTLQWRSKAGLFDSTDNAAPCDVHHRDNGLFDPSHAYDRQDSIMPTEMTFTVSLRIGKRMVKFSGVPRNAILFFDGQYVSDNFLRGAFRHPIMLPDDMVPPAWRDLKDQPAGTPNVETNAPANDEPGSGNFVS